MDNRYVNINQTSADGNKDALAFLPKEMREMAGRSAEMQGASRPGQPITWRQGFHLADKVTSAGKVRYQDLIVGLSTLRNNSQPKQLDGLGQAAQAAALGSAFAGLALLPLVGIGLVAYLYFKKK